MSQYSTAATDSSSSYSGDRHNWFAAERWITREQKKYLQERMVRFFKTQAYELPNDKKLLNSIPGPGRNNIPWFDYTGVLPYLSKYLPRDSNNSELRAIERKVRDKRWFNAR